MAFRGTLDVRNGVSALPQSSMPPFGKRDLKGIQPHQAWPGSTRRLLEVWEMEDSGLRVRVMKVEVARGQREAVWIRLQRPAWRGSGTGWPATTRRCRSG